MVSKLTLSLSDEEKCTFIANAAAPFHRNAAVHFHRNVEVHFHRNAAVPFHRNAAAPLIYPSPPQFYVCIGHRKSKARTAILQLSAFTGMAFPGTEKCVETSHWVWKPVRGTYPINHWVATTATRTGMTSEGEKNKLLVYVRHTGSSRTKKKKSGTELTASVREKKNPKTHKILKERFLIGRNRTKTCIFSRKPSF